MDFLGFEHQDGSVGVRNYLAIMAAGPSTFNMALQIAEEVRGAMPILPDDATLRLKEDRERARRTMVGLGRNPNVGAVLLVGFGEGHVNLTALAEEISQTKKPVEVVTVQSCNGYGPAMTRGVALARRLMSEVSRRQRKRLPLSGLTLGLKCGGSAGNSGILGNLVTGRVVDRVISSGGSVVFSETTEVIGADHLLAKRAMDADVARRFKEMVNRMETRIRDSGEDIRGSQPTPDNIQNGLTTLEEKSLGALAKTGSGPLHGVLEHAEQPKGKGLFFMDGPASTVSLLVGVAAAGAQITIYSLGGGASSAFRCLPGWGSSGMPLVPTLSVVSNASSPRDPWEEDFFDIHCQGVIDNKESIDQVAGRLMDEVLSVASGKMTRAEVSLPHYWAPLEMYQTGPIL
jgi:altronate dehydratase large subunit